MVADETKPPRKSGENVPQYARVDVNIDKLLPDRVRLQRAGRLAVELPDPDDEAVEEKRVDWTPPILEALPNGKFFRVICRDADVQLAAYVPGSNLATVAKEPVVLHPKAEPPDAATDKDPGARIAKGAVLTSLGTLGSVDHLRFESVGLAADGFARRAKIGPTFTPDTSSAALSGPARYDAELARADAVLYPEPNTKSKFVVAKLSPYPEGQGAHRLLRLGLKKNGFTLVRLLHPETVVVGWIEDGALKSASGEVTFEKEHQTGVSRLRGSKMMSLKRGTVLSAPKSGEAIGVVLADHETPCLKRCDSDTPTVAVRACGGVTRVAATR